MRIERFYRDFSCTWRWKSYRVQVETSDLYVRSTTELSKRIENLVKKYRREIELHIRRQPEFLTSFEPVSPLEGAPPIIMSMYRASEKAGVGPMAAVAGAIAQFVGEEIGEKTKEVVIENGGDIYIKIIHPLTLSVFAGDSPFTGKIGIKLLPEVSPLGICTSSATVGHSMSFGRADAFTVVAVDTALADAVATAGCNRIASEKDIEASLEYAMGIEGVLGAFAIYRDHLGAKGNIEFCPLTNQKSRENIYDV